MEFDGRAYSLLVSSDLPEDGMLAELLDGTPEARRVIADVLYSDRNRSLALRQYTPGIPVVVLEWFWSQARQRLSPTDASEPT